MLATGLFINYNYIKYTTMNKLQAIALVSLFGSTNAAVSNLRGAGIGYTSGTPTAPADHAATRATLT